MRQFYSLFKTLFILIGLLGVNQAFGQSSTIITGSGNCSAVVQNFNSNSGAHASPSIYGGMFDSAFYYNSRLGYWTEMDQSRTVGPLSPRVVTIISPAYINPNPPTIFDVGFWYQTPSALIDRFQVRLVQISPGPGGTTIVNIVASSGVQTFASWSTPFLRKIDAANPANSGDTGRICIRLVDQDITNGPNTFYRVEIAYVLNTPGVDNFFAAYDNLSIGPVTQQSPLPVDFMGIVAIQNDNAINVRWDVAEETNVEVYNLQRSTDGSTFSTVSTVPAQRKSVYGTSDRNTKAPVIYYRIQSRDNDGRTKYSGIIKVVSGNSFSNSVRVYPSPAISEVTVQHSRLGVKAKITITTLDGKVVRVITPASGTSNSMMNVSSLSAGMYVVRVDNGNGKIETTNFVKQ